MSAPSAINVQLGASTQQLQDGMEVAVTAIEKAIDRMTTALERMNERARTTSEETAESIEGLQHRVEHTGIAVAFAMEGLANGAETGVHRAEHAIAGLAFMFGPAAGSITTAIILATDYIIKFFTKAREEAEKTEQKFQETLEGISRGHNLEEASQKAQFLFSGDPSARRGTIKGETDDQFLIRSKGALGLQDAIAKLNAVQQDATDAWDKAQIRLRILNPLLEEQLRLHKQALEVQQQETARENEITKNKFDAGAPKREQEEKKKAFEEEMTQLEVVMAEAGDNSLRKLEILDEETEIAKQYFGEQSREYEQALARQIEAQNAASKAVTKVIDDDAKHQQEVDKKELEDFFKYLELRGKEHARLLKEMQEGWQKVFDPVAGTFDKMVSGILKGTQTISTAWHNLWSDFLLGSLDAGLKSLAHHEATELAKQNISAERILNTAAMEAWGALQAIASNAYAALVAISNYAWQAIAATWAAVSAIPFIGPFLAPAMAASAGAAILAMAGNIRSAQFGFDVPAGMNPVTQLHAQEMVLPADLANKVRGMSGGGGGGTPVIVQAWDTQSLADFARRNPDFFGNGVAGAMKNNHTALRKALG